VNYLLFLALFLKETIMCKLPLCLSLLGVLLTLEPAVGQETPAAVIAKAIKAQGGEETLRKFKAIQATHKGMMDVGGMSVSGTSETYLQLADDLDNVKYKQVLEITVNGGKMTIVHIKNRDKVSMTLNGMAFPLQDAHREEMKQLLHAESVASLLPLKDKKYTLALLPETTIRDHTAVGVKVSAAGYRDVSLYFDKENGLLVKRAYRGANDLTTIQDHLLETYCSDYRDFDGIKFPVKERIERDGKRFLETELVALKRLEKFDDKTFQP
jgi:hypothetical protein